MIQFQPVHDPTVPRSRILRGRFATFALGTLSAAGLLISGCAGPSAGQAPGETAPALEASGALAERPRTLTVIAISDFHGALEPQELRTQDGEVVIQGGAALLAAYIERIRAQSEGPVLILDGGDLFQGTLASNLALGAPVIQFYNHLGVAAAAVGNHEFDFGPETTARTIAIEPGDHPQGALTARAAEAAFPLLAINMLDEEGQIPAWSGASHIVEVEGLRIGIIGAATEDTAATTITANVAGLTFPFAGELVAAEAERLRTAEQVDVVLLTAHAGSGCTRFDDPDDLSSCRPGELLRLLEASEEGTIAVAVGGHTHMGVAHRYRGTVMLQSFSQGRALTWATIDLTTPGLPATPHGPVEVCGSTVEGDRGPTCNPRAVSNLSAPVSPAQFLGSVIIPDPATEALLADDFASVASLRSRDLGVSIDGPIPLSYREESALGNLVADAMRMRFPEADAAVTNGGGVRAELADGRLTYGALFGVLPFDTRFVVLEIDGATLRRIVEHGITSGRSALLWSGLTLEVRDCDVTSITVGTEPLDDARTYTIVLNDYLAGGGSGFDTLDLPEMIIRWDIEPVRDAIAESLGRLPSPLRAMDFLDPSSPRQVRIGSCGGD
jgi:5'-nucleotidase